MANSPSTPAAGFVTFTLHSHLPYVVHHGTWPHGLDWLHEAAAETYLPLLRVFAELESQGLALKANVNLSPILLEQLAHPTFKEEFLKYAKQKIDAAEKDADDFRRRGESHFAQVAEFWARFFENAASHFESLGRDIVSGFRHFYDSGAIEIITCGATHGYFALLGTDASIRAQVRMGVATHERFFGRRPRGIWLPECAYRPAGPWQFPVAPAGMQTGQPFERAGVEEILAENGIEFFFVDTHLVENNAVFTPYDLLAGDVPIATEIESETARGSFYRPYFADTPKRREHQVAFFTRDPRTGVQVWSGEQGYPGESAYLDFHKKRWPGGHRYWQVTNSKTDLANKTAYYPERALARTADHARHFSHITTVALQDYSNGGANGAIPILTAPFDAELFGHWWFEGPEWLKNVVLEYAHPGSQVQLISCSEYLDRFPPSGFLALPEGSWGRHGTHEVWLNPQTEWTWREIYPAELEVEQIVENGRWRKNQVGERLVKQLCRELLLLESSDWQFLITTGSARDYAEKRFHTHLEQFHSVLSAWREFEAAKRLRPESEQQLAAIEARDSVFPGIEPEMWMREKVTA